MTPGRGPERRVNDLEKRAAREHHDADGPVVPDDPHDLPHDEETYYLRTVEHTSATRDLGADLPETDSTGEATENDSDGVAGEDDGEGPWPHAAERYVALRAANRGETYDPDATTPLAPKHVRQNPFFGVN